MFDKKESTKKEGKSETTDSRLELSAIGSDSKILV